MDMKIYVDHRGTIDAGTLNQKVLHVVVERRLQYWTTQYFVEAFKRDFDYRRLLNRHQVRMVSFEIITFIINQIPLHTFCLKCGDMK